MMKKVDLIHLEAEPLMKLGGNLLYQTSAAGTFEEGCGKDGMTKTRGYQKGAFVLVDEDHILLAGPIDLAGAAVISADIATGNQRRHTDPAIGLRLATAILGVTALMHQPPETEPQTQNLEEKKHA